MDGLGEKAKRVKRGRQMKPYNSFDRTLQRGVIFCQLIVVKTKNKASNEIPRNSNLYKRSSENYVWCVSVTTQIKDSPEIDEHLSNEPYTFFVQTNYSTNASPVFVFSLHSFVDNESMALCLQRICGKDKCTREDDEAYNGHWVHKGNEQSGQ